MIDIGQKDFPRADLRNCHIQSEVLQVIPEEIARKYTVIPLSVTDNCLRVAMADPSNIFAIEALTSRSQMRVEPEIASPQEVNDAIDFNYKGYKEIERQVLRISPVK